MGGITYINDNSATISHCENVGIILAESGNSTEVKDTISSLVNESSIHLGGIAGKTDWHSTIDQCRATCTIRITGESHYEYWYIGGIVGSGFVATFSNCCFNGTLSINVDIKDVASGIYKVGGLAGDGGYESKYENCYVSGVITDNSQIGTRVPLYQDRTILIQSVLMTKFFGAERRDLRPKVLQINGKPQNRNISGSCRNPHAFLREC